MFNRSDLTTLIEAAPKPGVSIFMPTHVKGVETRQDPIRLKNLLGEAAEQLQQAGMDHNAAEAVLAPAAALVGDYDFWQHQSRGLALFVDQDGMRSFKVPVELAEHVVVGEGFHVKPLLPLMAADGSFHVLTLTMDQVRLFTASRFTLAEEEGVDLPRSLADVTSESSDYEDPLQASPANRPNRSPGSGAPAGLAKSQVFGDAPEEWRKTQLLVFLRRIGAAIKAHLDSHPRPVVVVGDAEMAGNFQKLAGLDRLLAGVVEANPEAMEPEALHDAAYAVMRPQLDEERARTLDRLGALLGSGDPRGMTIPADVVSAAHQGRVETVLLAEGVELRGRYDAVADKVVVGGGAGKMARDLLDLAAVETLRHGGAAYVLPRGEMPRGAEVAAILRY